MDKRSRKNGINDFEEIIFSNNPEKQNRYFIYQRTGGLGDMILGLYFVWAYSLKYKRKVIVDWRGSTYLRNKENIFSVFFEKEFKILDIFIKSYDENLEYPEPFYPNFSNNEFIRNNWDYQEFLNDRGKFCIDSNSEYKSHSNLKKIMNHLNRYRDVEELTIHTGRQISLAVDFNRIPKIMSHIFFKSLSSYYTQEMKDLINEKRKLFGDKKIIGVHIRNGNGKPFYYDFEKETYYISENLEEYINYYIEQILKTNKGYCLFVCTDSEEIINIIKNKKIKNILFMEREIVRRGSEPHHIHWMENPYKVMIEAFIEMNLLSYCNKIYGIGTHSSSFSLFPTFINNKPQLIRVGVNG
jgi:hypothetical protein